MSSVKRDVKVGYFIIIFIIDTECFLDCKMSTLPGMSTP